MAGRECHRRIKNAELEILLNCAGAGGDVALENRGERGLGEKKEGEDDEWTAERLAANECIDESSSGEGRGDADQGE